MDKPFPDPELTRLTSLVLAVRKPHVDSMDRAEYAVAVTPDVVHRLLVEIDRLKSETTKDEDDAYELGKRDGYESAIQDLDLETGGDGEFKGSTIPGATVDVPAMKRRVIARLLPIWETINEPDR